jgi:large subunit ribosomal protein L7Ae
VGRRHVRWSVLLSSPFLPSCHAQEDQREFGKLIDTCKAHFNEGPRINWGGHILGPKSQHKQLKRERAIAKELAQRATV